LETKPRIQNGGLSLKRAGATQQHKNQVEYSVFHMVSKVRIKEHYHLGKSHESSETTHDLKSRWDYLEEGKNPLCIALVLDTNRNR
jgi:hypothetical protein